MPRGKRGTWKAIKPAHQFVTAVEMELACEDCQTPTVFRLDGMGQDPVLLCMACLGKRVQAVVAERRAKAAVKPKRQGRKKIIARAARPGLDSS